MALVLEIEHLLGVAFAAQSPASAIPDWPPQPDRVFSALVAAWGARGERPDERRALEWLEAQPAPAIAASEGLARTPASTFVPPNDPESARVGNPLVMPAFRRRQPRRFPAFRPDNPVVHLVWRDIEVDTATVAALNALAADTPYIGHSASLTRCRFRTEDGQVRTEIPRRRVYAGRLAELERAYRAGRRPSSGEEVRAATIVGTMTRRSVFSDYWLVLEHVEGRMPDLRATALVSKALRAALMSGYKGNGQSAAIPTLVSGHEVDGSPSVEPHLAIAPLAFLGSQYADGRVLGCALIPPGDGKLLAEEDFRAALRGIAPWNAKASRRELRIIGDGLDLTLTLSSEGNRRSLDPTVYVSAAKTWATCTPIVLDRHLKAKGNAERETEVEHLLRKACLNIGLPEPARVAVSKHSAVNGVPSAYPSARSPRWTRWRLPRSLDSRQLTHAILQFAEPVRGPLILGAGRFVGLGLCRALDVESR